MACGGTENIDESMQEDSYDYDDMSLDQQEPNTLQNFQLSSGFVLNTKVVKERTEGDSRLLPASTSVDFNFLRRSSSIPLINGFGDNSQGFQFDTERMRRNSLPFLNRRALKGKLVMVLNEEILAIRSGGAQLYMEFEANLPYKRLCLKSRLTSKFLPIRIRTSANRIFQIKQEEGMDIVRREAMHERQVHTVMQMTQSWNETINLNDYAFKPVTIRSIKPIPVSPVASLKRPRMNLQDNVNF